MCRQNVNDSLSSALSVKIISVSGYFGDDMFNDYIQLWLLMLTWISCAQCLCSNPIYVCNLYAAFWFFNGVLETFELI